MQKQAAFEAEMSKKVQHLESLQQMEPKLEEMHPEQLENIKAHRLVYWLFIISWRDHHCWSYRCSERIHSFRIAVTEQLQRLKIPLDDRRKHLERKKAAFQFVRDVEDEKLWCDERLPVARAPQIGENLFDCHRLQKNTQSLRNEVDNHEPWINQILVSLGADFELLVQIRLYQFPEQWPTAD
jgi:hypothetical protein